MKELDLRRHARRQPDEDALSSEGRAQAEHVGATLPTDYAVVFVSPAKRAAETVAWFLRGSRQLLPDHAIVAGLVDGDADQAEVVADLFGRVPDGGRGLAVGHTPLLERAVEALTGVAIRPLGECEGVRLIRDDHGTYRVEELRLP